MSKILVIDIEWEPAQAYVWKAWDENISPDQIIDNGGMLCFAAKWLGQKDVYFYSKWEDGREGMAQAALYWLEQADAVVTYNGDKYDIPKLRGEILLAGLTPPPPLTSIDLIKTVKGLGFFMNRLAFIGPLLAIGTKVKHEGFNLWRSVMDGDVKAQARMKKYCIGDVKLTEQLYKRIKPFIKQHPHLGKDKHECGSCGSNNTQLRGFHRTKYYKTQRIQCQDCGSWSLGTRTKIT